VSLLCCQVQGLISRNLARLLVLLSRVECSLAQGLTLRLYVALRPNRSARHASGRLHNVPGIQSNASDRSSTCVRSLLRPYLTSTGPSSEIMVQDRDRAAWVSGCRVFCAGEIERFASTSSSRDNLGHPRVSDPVDFLNESLAGYLQGSCARSGVGLPARVLVRVVERISQKADIGRL